MKRLITLLFIAILFVLLCACDNQKSIDDQKSPNAENLNSSSETEHENCWQEVQGEHARICSECNEKQLKPEACNFVRISCDQPMECTVCHAIDNGSIDDHNWQIVSQDDGCWYSNITYACSNCDMEQTAHADFGLPNHSWADETENGKTTFLCTRCGESNTLTSEIRKFSYAHVLEEYKIGDPGVKHENFNICFECEVVNAIDAVTIAKLELTVEYDTISVSYDEEADIWCVDFWTLDMVGGGQSVYIKGNGLTCYIVYGE